MQNLKFYSILGLSALLMLSACKKDEPNSGTEDVSPVLTLSQTTLTVDPEGEVTSVAYLVSNPVEEGTVSVDLGDVTWITDVNITDSTIDLTVEANSESDSRTATLTVSYPGAEDVSLTVFQEKYYDFNLEAPRAVATYYSHSGDVMNVRLYFTDMDINLNPPGYLLYLDTYMTYNEDKKITLGTYEVNDTENSLTIMPSYRSDISIYESEETGWFPDYTSYIISGTMTVTAGTEENNYTIVCDFTTADGSFVKCTYSGFLIVYNMSEPASTLDGDITVDLDGAIGIAYDSGDLYYDGGKTWWIFIEPESGFGDALVITLTATWGDFEDGIPSGTYTPTINTFGFGPGIGCYLAGYMTERYGLAGTWYYYNELGELGYYTRRSPAMSGDITFTNHGDGTYDLEFECTDDLGYIWSGTWSGTITPAIYSSASTSAASLSKHPTLSKFSIGEMSTKAIEMKAAQ